MLFMLFTSMESLFGTSQVSKVSYMQRKTLLGCKRRVQFVLLINKTYSFHIYIILFKIYSFVMLYNTISTVVPAYYNLYLHI